MTSSFLKRRESILGRAAPLVAIEANELSVDCRIATTTAILGLDPDIDNTSGCRRCLLGLLWLARKTFGAILVRAAEATSHPPQGRSMYMYMTFCSYWTDFCDFWVPVDDSTKEILKFIRLQNNVYTFAPSRATRNAAAGLGKPVGIERRGPADEAGEKLKNMPMSRCL